MSAAHTVIEGFHRTDASGASVSFTGSINDDGSLEKELRAQGVYAHPGATQVIVLLNNDGHLPGNCRGTVAVAGGEEHALRSVELAIKALEDALDGLRECGHHDWE